VPIREFVDAAGVSWRVWSTVPYTAIGVAGAMQRGWLTFESLDQRRRLVPIPEDWESASLAELRSFCRRAEPVAQTPNSGTWRLDLR
jgi:hypothetical protein